MNELQKAYQALGLEPGAQFETIKRRYRRLALVWHPDRMTNAEAKREAEEELKKINNNFEKLKKAF
jgi:COMPASS component SWD3